MQIEKLKYIIIIVCVNVQYFFLLDDSNIVGEVLDYMILVNDVDVGGLKRYLLILEKERVMLIRNINVDGWLMVLWVL